MVGTHQKKALKQHISTNNSRTFVEAGLSKFNREGHSYYNGKANFKACCLIFNDRQPIVMRGYYGI